jgi:hypothetical protein
LLEQRTANDIKKLKIDYDKNKNKVIEFILESVLDVDMTIPDVVKGQFSKKMGVKK